MAETWRDEQDEIKWLKTFDTRVTASTNTSIFFAHVTTNHGTILTHAQTDEIVRVQFCFPFRNGTLKSRFEFY